MLGLRCRGSGHTTLAIGAILSYAAPDTLHRLELSSAHAAALQSIEHQTHRKFLDSKLPRGSMLLEVGACQLAMQRTTSHCKADAWISSLLMSCCACILQMVYRHLEAEAGVDDEAEADGRARVAEEALLSASVRAHGTTSALSHPTQA